MRVFVQIKQFALTNNDLTQRLDEMENQFIQYARDMNINIEDIYKQLNYLTDITKPSQIGFKTKAKSHNKNAPDGNRTHDLRLRRPLLYPTELQTHVLQI